jgi:hypothetical protein
VSVFLPLVAGPLATVLTASDPFFANVELLLHAEGSNGSTTITDSSASPKTVTASSTCAISTARFKFGTSSILGGSTGYFTASLGSGGNMTGDFTWESWIYGGANRVVFYSTGANSYIYSNVFSGYGAADLPITSNLSAGWHHLAISRTGSALKGYTNGALIGSQSYSGTVDLQTLACGYYVPNGNLHWTENYDEMRVTKGVGRYPSAFTPPVAAFPNS